MRGAAVIGPAIHREVRGQLTAWQQLRGSPEIQRCSDRAFSPVGRQAKAVRVEKIYIKIATLAICACRGPPRVDTSHKTEYFPSPAAFYHHVEWISHKQRKSKADVNKQGKFSPIANGSGCHVFLRYHLHDLRYNSPCHSLTLESSFQPARGCKVPRLRGIRCWQSGDKIFTIRSPCCAHIFPRRRDRHRKQNRRYANGEKAANRHLPISVFLPASSASRRGIVSVD